MNELVQAGRIKSQRRDGGKPRHEAEFPLALRAHGCSGSLWTEEPSGQGILRPGRDRGAGATRASRALEVRMQAEQILHPHRRWAAAEEDGVGGAEPCRLPDLVFLPSGGGERAEPLSQRPQALLEAERAFLHLGVGVEPATALWLE